ncbi:SpdD-like protein [Streptomyces fradiae]|uniref:SpdD-like protein n=1 Tax=Streptomyces fradiae TaxID=1906 RepID=UPI002941FA98|nr:SpdD-like protein [Streptomyces fradiae]WOI58954.1 SpdD-like protein [Streptomyces fradiae]
MFRPKLPTMPQPTGLVAPPAIVESNPVAPTVPAPQPASVAPVSSRPVVQLTSGGTLALAGGGAAVVLVVGAVLVSMLLAAAVTAASVAVCAVVVRSVLKDH